MNLQNKRVVVTGGNGFLGRYLVRELQRRGCKNIFIPRSTEFDLRTPEDVRAMYYTFKPNVVIHAAAHCGGILLNKEKPAELFYDNAIMGILMMEEARKNGVEKYVQMGTCCSYPKHTPVPFCEDEIWNGYPEETNAPYGIAKKALMVQGQAYRQQYGFDAIHLLVVNLYGPGDNTSREHSHVIPALIGKFIEAKKNNQSEVVVWGTGHASREFFYVEDAAKDIISAVEKYDGYEPLNLGTGVEITILDLARIIARKIGFEGRLVFNAGITDGQPHRCMNVDKARQAFELCPKTSLEMGLDKTINWYYNEVKHG
jgi:GDP-L-fucose synthase